MAVKKVFVGLIAVGILVASFATMFILIETKPESVKRPNKLNILGVRTDIAEYGDFSIDMTYPGRVTARDILTLSSQVSGMMMPTNVRLKVGETFRKGDLLVKIFDEDVVAAQNAKISQFMTTLSTSLPDIRIDFPEQYEKWSSFFRAINIGKKLPKLPSITSEKEKVYLSSKGILAAYYNLIQSELILERYEIRAPFTGAYLSVNKEVGSITTMNGEIGRIVSTDALELIVGVSLEDAQILSKGIKLNIKSQSGKIYKGVVNRISPFVDRATQRVNVYISFNEPGLDIIEGQLLEVTLPSKELAEVIEINREAIVGDTLIYVVKDNMLVGQPVDLVAKTSLKVYVTGIEEGATFVGESLVSPYEGMPVKVLDMEGEIISIDK